jgi:hypothetical protein
MSYRKWNVWTFCKNINVTMCQNSKGSQHQISREVKETEELCWNPSWANKTQSLMDVLDPGSRGWSGRR